MIFAIFLISLTVSAENLKCSECHSIVFSSNQIDGDGAKCFEGSPERESESKHIKLFLIIIEFLILNIMYKRGFKISLRIKHIVFLVNFFMNHSFAIGCLKTSKLEGK